MSEDDSNPILFYGHRRLWGQFSNFFHAPFELDGRVWPTVEHYFVAQKNTDYAWQERIRKVESPGRVKRLGREVKLQPGWDDIKVRIMGRAVLAKFEQNPALAEFLLMTGDRPLHENCHDPWWGGGPNYPKGRDLLGKILMRVRITLRTQQS